MSMATVTAFICIIAAAIAFESPGILWWYIVALFIADYEL